MTFRILFLMALVLIGIASVGCDRSARSLPLDQSQARQACEAALKAWQAGKTPGDLRPAITVGDYGWNAGQTLVDFEILPDDTSDGTNLHIPVRLTLKDAGGKESKSTATYTVGTSPVVTVFRK